MVPSAFMPSRRRSPGPIGKSADGHRPVEEYLEMSAFALS
jgi:hypothetical protein